MAAAAAAAVAAYKCKSIYQIGPDERTDGRVISEE